MSNSTGTFVAHQWNHMPDIHDTHGLDEGDRLCLDAIRDVLAEHGKTERFGVNLLHKHFEMAPDEILVESVDEVGRRLVVKPVKVEVVLTEMSRAYETQWSWQRKSTGELTQICNSRCFPGNYESPGHVNKHVGW